MARGRGGGGRSYGGSHHYGGRGGGIGGRSYGGSHHYGGRGGGRGTQSYFQVQQILIDAVASSVSMPSILNGVYSHQGSEMAVTSQLQNFYAIEQQNQQLAATSGIMYIPASQASLYIVGAKTSARNQFCSVITMIAGMLCIFPLFFMCCGWWKKIVSPKYEIRAQTYQAIGQFLARNPSIRTLTLNIVDNAFNASKARIVYQFTAAAQLSGLTFQNQASQINYMESQHSDFVANMAPIKTLSTASVCSWGEQVLI